MRDLRPAADLRGVLHTAAAKHGDVGIAEDSANRSGAATAWPMAENASVKSASRTSHWASVPRKAERFPGSTSLSSTSETNSAPQTVRRRKRSCDAPEGCCSLRRLPAAALRFVRAAARRFPVCAPSGADASLRS
ncbi:MAG: hypothetical protein ACLR4W_03495 [Oscillospiraceae bacterium]